MDTNEVYMLLMVVEKAHAQGTSFLNIRNAAIDRLKEIEAELGSEQVEAAPEPEPEPEPEEETEDAA